MILMKISRFLTAAAVGFTAAAIPVFPALAALTGAVHLGTNAGYDGVYNGAPAGNYMFEVEGVDVLAYCADESLPLNGAASFTVVAAASSGISGVDAAGYIAANSTSIGSPLADASSEASAVQLAVWFYTNGAALDADSVPFPSILSRAVELVSAPLPADLAPNAGPVSFVLNLTGTVDSDSVVFAASLTDHSGVALAGQVVEFVDSAGNSSPAVTGADGLVSLTVPAISGSTVTMKVEYSGVIPGGSVLAPDDGSQPLVLVSAVEVARSAFASVVVDLDYSVTGALVAAAAEPYYGEMLAHTGPSDSTGVKMVVGLVLLVGAGLGAIPLPRRRLI